MWCIPSEFRLVGHSGPSQRCIACVTNAIYAYPDHNNYLSISSCFVKQRAKYIHVNTGLNEFYYLSGMIM